jgi:hypothetical protein
MISPQTRTFQNQFLPHDPCNGWPTAVAGGTEIHHFGASAPCHLSQTPSDPTDGKRGLGPECRKSENQTGDAASHGHRSPNGHVDNCPARPVESWQLRCQSCVSACRLPASRQSSQCSRRPSNACWKFRFILSSSIFLKDHMRPLPGLRASGLVCGTESAPWPHQPALGAVSAQLITALLLIITSPSGISPVLTLRRTGKTPSVSSRYE